jgi:hypothetical protein
MKRQYRHDSASVGAPCGRCGLVYSQKTAYVPCFEEGDTFEMWMVRQPAELRPMLRPPSVGVAKPREVFVGDDVDDGARPPDALDYAKQAAGRALRRLAPIGNGVAADVALAELSALIVAQIRNETADLVARVEELEAELAKRGQYTST